MKRLSNFIWPVIALLAMGFSFWLLYKELRGLSAGDVFASLAAIPKMHLLYAFGSTIVAYAALAWYDRIGLMHLGHKFSWLFISTVSFTTYALSHNIGFSMFSGAVVRYRAYSTKGLGMAEIAFLVAFCSFTFGLGTVLLGGLVLVFEPQIITRFELPQWMAWLAGAGMLGFVALYFIGSTLHLPPLVLGKFKLVYPRVNITLRQMVAAPIELLGAAGIIYFALPEAGNPGFFIVLGIFLASFSAGLLSHAPGGLGVIEYVFVKALPEAEMPHAQVIAALIVFRLLYLILPLASSLVVVFFFERGRLADVLKMAAPLPKTASGRAGGENINADP